MPRVQKRETEPEESLVESEHYVAVEVDRMTVAQKLQVLEAYQHDSEPVVRTFRDNSEEIVEVWIFRKRQ
jgi:hypothetical protein